MLETGEGSTESDICLMTRVLGDKITESSSPSALAGLLVVGDDKVGRVNAFGCKLSNNCTGPWCAWKAKLTRPVIIGTPSKRGRGTVRIIPTLVPTHKSPLLANRDVTKIIWGDFSLSLAKDKINKIYNYVKTIETKQ